MKYRKTILLIVAMALSASAYASDAAFPASYESAGNGISQDAEFPFTAAVKQNGKWGAVNGEGKTVIPIAYDKIALSLSDEEIRSADLASEDDRADLIEVKQKNLRGFYDRSGKKSIPFLMKHVLSGRKDFLPWTAAIKKSVSTRKTVQS